MRKQVEDLIGRAVEWVWHRLRDRCRMPGCRRQGIRGKEIKFGQMLVCRDCYEKLTSKRWRDMWEKPFNRPDLT